MYSLGNTLGLSRPCRRSAVLTALSLAVFGICLFPLPTCAKYDGGVGTEASPYLIRTARQMNDIGAAPSDWNKHFRLATDLDMNDFTGDVYNIIGTSTTQSFSGIFDGSGHEIFNFNISTSQQFHTGLFGCVSGEVKNLGLVKPVVLAQGSRVGALVGQIEHGQVTSCYARGGRVSGDDDVGVLVGRNAGRIFTSYSSGSVSGDTFIGGLVGLLTDGTINTSFSKADVTGNINVGGLVGKTGHETSAARNCYATGDVVGDTNVGGLIGQIERGAAERCFSAGSVSGNQYVGGLVGRIRVLGMLMHCFWDTEASGQPTSAGGTGKTTVEMKTIDTFFAINWDFAYTWTICEELNYPIFIWQIPTTDYLCPDGVGFIDFAYFAQRWHREGCGPANGNCQGADVDRSGIVDFIDFEIFANRWMAGTQ